MDDVAAAEVGVVNRDVVLAVHVVVIVIEVKYRYW